MAAAAGLLLAALAPATPRMDTRAVLGQTQAPLGAGLAIDAQTRLSEPDLSALDGALADSASPLTNTIEHFAVSFALCASGPSRPSRPPPASGA